MTLVAGVDSSTQSCKVLVVDAATGALVRVEGRAPHPDGTEVDPAAWLAAFRAAVDAAGGLDDVAAVGIGGQQHGMVLLDDSGAVVRPALLWNDTRSAPQAAELIAELGADIWARAVGSVPLAAFTVTKLRWVAEREPESAARAAAVCLPHDWLRWQLAGADGLDTLVTDRGDASGTGYWSPATGDYRHDLLVRAFGRDLQLPTVVDPLASTAVHAPPGGGGAGARLSAGTGDNMAAALGLSLTPGDVVISIGTSGTVFAVADRPTADPTGAVAGFADATGNFLPLVCTLNAAQVLDVVPRRMLGVDLAMPSTRLALSALPPDAGGITLLPYLAGERTPNRPDATGHLASVSRAVDCERHAGEPRAGRGGGACCAASPTGVDALVAQGVADPDGSSSSAALPARPRCRRLAPSRSSAARSRLRRRPWRVRRTTAPPARPPARCSAPTRSCRGPRSPATGSAPTPPRRSRDAYAVLRDATG